jgi:hypothetical protein
MEEKSKTSEKISLKNVRLSFLKLDKPEAFEKGQVEKYQATALLDPSDAEHAKLIALVKKTAADLCTEAYSSIPDEIKAEPLKRLPFGLADAHPKKKDYDGYKGMFYVACSNATKPGIANRAGQSVLPGEPQFPYSGAYGNVNFTLWALLGPSKVKYGARLGANLVGVQFARDGEAFGQGPISAEDEFEALPDDPAAFGDTGAPVDDDIPF